MNVLRALGFGFLFLIMMTGTACQQSVIHGSGGREVIVYQPNDIVLRRGYAETLDVAIKCINFNEPVTMRVFDLPAGVSAEDQSLVTNKHGVHIALVASAEAEFVQDHSAQYEVTGPDGKTATRRFRISVKE